MDRRTALMILALVSSAASMGFTQNMMNISLPMVADAYHVSITMANWTVVFYNVMTSTCTCMAAALMRRVGLRNLLTASGALLAVGSLVGVLSRSFATLMVARLVQGVATGLTTPVVVGSIALIVPLRHRGAVFAINSGTLGVMAAAGPLVTGYLLTRFGLGPIFVVPTCLGIALVVLDRALLTDVEPRERVPIDLPSVVLALLGLGGLMFGLSEVTHDVAPSIVAMAVGACVLGGFVWRQLRAAHPLLHLDVLRYPVYTVGAIFVVLAMMADLSSSLMLPLYYEGTAGMSAFAAGVLTFWPLVCYGLASLGVGRFFDRHPRSPLVPLGFALILAGAVGMSVEAAAGALWGVFWWSLAVFLGVGFISPPEKDMTLSALPPDRATDGSSVNATLVQVGYSTAAALFVGVLSADVARLTAAGMGRPDAYARGFSETLWISIGLAAVSLLCSIVYQRISDRRRPQVANGAAAEGDGGSARSQGRDGGR